MRKPLPKVDVIIVNYNGMRYIDSCLDALLKTVYPSFSVIVVDNGSSDGSIDFIRNKYPTVTIICNEKNLGFGKANEIGIRASESDLVALLNNDTIVKEGWLLPLVETLIENERTAAVCSKLLFMSNHRIINAVGGGMNYVGYGYDIGMYEDDNGLEGVGDVFFPCAAACLMKKSLFEEIGGFDKKFFMYHEDVDLGWRFRLRGYHIKCVPASVVYHAFGGTSLKVADMSFRNTLGLRHALRSLIKNYELPTLLKVLPLVFALGMRTTLKGRSLIFIKSLLWNIRMLPDTLKRRGEIQKNRRVSDSALSPLIWQQIELPVRYPEYRLVNLKTFAEEGNRRPFMEVTDTDNRWGNLGHGWHGVEFYFGDGKTKYRWTKDQASFFLWNKYGNGIISLDVLALSRLLDKERRISASVNNGVSYDFSLNSDEWETIEFSYEGDRGPIEVTIRAEDTWCPHDLFKNDDVRKLGVGIRRAELRPKGQVRPQIDGISVIIPTYNRSEILLRVLTALEAQTLHRDSFEVIVIDDGSTDATESEVRAFIGQTTLDIKYFKQQNKKQGAARNLGIKHAKKPLLVFIGDDILPSRDFLEEHLNYHRKNNKHGNMVVIGYTKWPEDMKVTPFMKFIGEYGYQFGYSLIQGEGPLPFNFFYTSNISVLKSFLGELEHVFDEDFSTYGWEDIELGYRLERIGMELYYNRNAVAYHDHQIDIPAFCRRQFTVGKASRVFLKEHPELRWFLGDVRDLKRMTLFAPAVSLLERVLNFVDKTFSISLSRIFYDIVLKANYARGALAPEE